MYSAVQIAIISSETVTPLDIFYDRMWSVRFTNESQIDAVLTSVSFSVFAIYTKRRANGIYGIRVELQEPAFELSG